MDRDNRSTRSFCSPLHTPVRCRRARKYSRETERLAGHFQTSNLSAYYNGSPITAMLLLAMIATVLIFLGSLILLVVAAVFYIPLLCYIQGNLKVSCCLEPFDCSSCPLKEYVCHKVDKVCERCFLR